MLPFEHPRLLRLPLGLELLLDLCLCVPLRLASIAKEAGPRGRLEPHLVGEDLPGLEVDGHLALGCSRDGLFQLLQVALAEYAEPRADDGAVAYEVVKYALVQRPLPVSALVQLLVVRLEALPVAPELLQAMLVEVLDSAPSHG